MHLTAALLVVVAAVTIAAPVQLSEEMLEEINALRAQGLSEQEITSHRPPSSHYASIHHSLQSSNMPSLSTAYSVPAHSESIFPTEPERANTMTRFIVHVCRKMGFRKPTETGVETGDDLDANERARQKLELRRLHDRSSVRGNQ